MNEKRLYAIRGAVCCENTVESITENVGKMCEILFKKNNVQAEDMVSIHFTMTNDLNVINAATALRKSNCCVDTSKVALFVSQEAQICGMLPKTIRIMLTVYLPENSKIQAVYLNGAEKLRPDFCD